MSDNVNGVNTDLLAVKAASGDDKAMAELINEIMPAAAAKASVLNSGSTRLADEDLVQEGMFGFLDSVKKFDISKGVPFKAFALACIENRIKSALRINSNSGNVALTGAVSFEDTENPRNSDDPASISENLDEEAAIRRITGELLSGFEQEILDLRLCDMSYSEIARELGCSEKSVDNALQRIRKKLRNSIGKDTE
ncbi:MAG: sigma-70 family RNA polymerase sigma factor [Clostridia bacterium]|nr:sigma-70 family RNA polymerase sigma factor [Clostridia bacterium]